MTAAADTNLEIEGVFIPLRAAAGFSEDWAEVNEPEVYHQWHGRAVVIGPMHKRKYTITINGGGAAVWRMPTLDELQFGDEVTLHSCKPRPAKIPTGATGCTLPRDFVSGSLFVRKLSSDEKVPFTVEGRVITLTGDAAAEPLVAHYRPKVVCLVVSTSGAADGAEATGTWTLVLVEKDAPA